MNGNQEYEKIWAEWLKSPDIKAHINSHVEHRRAFLDLLKKYASPGARVLEVGCGFAIDAAWLSAHAGSRSFGIDISFTSIQVALKACGLVSRIPHFAVADAKQLSFPDSSFDLVFSQGVLEHFEDPLPLLREQVRVTSPGGHIVVNVPQKFNPYTLYKRKKIREGTWEYGWETEYSFGGLRRLGDILGLEIVDQMGYGYEKGRDYGLCEIRELTKRMAATRRYPFLNRFGSLGERIWKRAEGRFGHWFCQNIAVVFFR